MLTSTRQSSIRTYLAFLIESLMVDPSTILRVVVATFVESARCKLNVVRDNARSLNVACIMVMCELVVETFGCLCFNLVGDVIACIIQRCDYGAKRRCMLQRLLAIRDLELGVQHAQTTFRYQSRYGSHTTRQNTGDFGCL